MVIFQDFEEVEEWLEPLDYIAFWEAVAPYRIFSIAERDHCDALITGGKAKQATILKGLKYMACDVLADTLRLQHRRHETINIQATKSVH